MQRVRDHGVLSSDWEICITALLSRLRDLWERKARKIIRARGSQCLNLPDVTSQFHPWTPSSCNCMHRTCTGPSHRDLNTSGGGFMKSHALLRSYWQLMVAGGRKVSILRATVPERLPVLQKVVLHSSTSRHRLSGHSEFFKKCTRSW